MKFLARIPAPGFTWNPLLKLERNGPCICGSGKKYKKCCLPAMPSFLPQQTVKDLRKKP